jgi:hypothetical protein
MTNNYTYSTQAATVPSSPSTAAGSAYAVGDTGTIGSGGATYTVATVTSTGKVKTVTVSPLFSSAYTVGTTYSTTKTSENVRLG